MSRDRDIGRQPISQELRSKIYCRDEHACVYCGLSGEDVRLQIDHVYPVIRGGTNHELNLVTACRECNTEKNDMTMEEWESKVRSKHGKSLFEYLVSKAVKRIKAEKKKAGKESSSATSRKTVRRIDITRGAR